MHCSASISHASLTTSVEGLFLILVMSTGFTTGSVVVVDLDVGLVAEAWSFEHWAGAGAAQSSLNDIAFVPLAFAHRSSSNSHGSLIILLPTRTRVTPSSGFSVIVQ